MKIEKINDNQIKCTLTRSDLASRQLKLSELAYGTEKARDLFQDMMEQANMEFGFEASDDPFTIEAIPVSMDCIVLMITKVDDPDEIDSRYSTLTSAAHIFADAPSNEDSFVSSFHEFAEQSLNGLHDLFKRVAESKSSSPTRLYCFDKLETVLSFAQHIASYTLKESSLYKSTEDQKYYLYLVSDASACDDFTRITNCGLEFGTEMPVSSSRVSYMNEHFEKILSGNAVQNLACI